MERVRRGPAIPNARHKIDFNLYFKRAAMWCLAEGVKSLRDDRTPMTPQNVVFYINIVEII